MSGGNVTRCLLCRFVKTHGLKSRQNYVAHQRQALQVLKPFYALRIPFSSGSQLRSNQEDDGVGTKDPKMNLTDGKQENTDRQTDTSNDGSSSSSDSSDSDSDKKSKKASKPRVKNKFAKEGFVPKDPVINKYAKQPSSNITRGFLDSLSDRTERKEGSSDGTKSKGYREGFLSFQRGENFGYKGRDRWEDSRDQNYRTAKDDWPDRRDRDRQNERPRENRQQKEKLADILKIQINFGIFTKEDYQNPKEPIKTLFDTVAQEEREEPYKHSPFSALEEQLQWTREGKLWHFPIDNEQGWEEEKNCSFQDHAFFNEQMKDFPRKGPVRHFMELVTTALSKNPYLSVKEKHETIEWYKEYFKEHREILMEKYGEEGSIREEQYEEQIQG